MEGWVKLYRKILDNPIICKDSDYFSVWCYLLLSATHSEYDVLFNNGRITLKPGQLITGRKTIADKFKISESKVTRILKKLEIEQQIEQQTTTQNRLITILNWELYQQSEQPNEQRVNNDRTTSEQQVNTNKNIKNVENDKNEEKNNNIVDQVDNASAKNKKEDSKLIKSIIDYLNMKTGKSYKTSTSKTRTCIHARTAEGFKQEDFIKVIDIKVAEWKGTSMEMYLRPETLFGTKFEGYLNQKEAKNGQHRSNNGEQQKQSEFPDTLYNREWW